MASSRFLRSSIVVYPEIVTGNPLNAKSVLRWILRTPSDDFWKKYSLSDGNIFYFREKFVEGNLLKVERRHLQAPYFPLQIIRSQNLPRKRKFCFIRHKNKTTPSIDLGDDAICLDGKSVGQIVKIFNDTEHFVSYDTETGYTRLAIFCGAIPIVVPDGNVTKNAWRPIERERLGIAYGFSEDEIRWAVQTRDLAISETIDRSEDAKVHVYRFATEVSKIYPQLDLSSA
jgi:hypothetical protein